MSATAMPSYLSPRRLSLSDRIGRVRRSPFARDLRRIAPRTSVALLLGLLIAGVVLTLLQIRNGAPVSFGLVNGR